MKMNIFFFTIIIQISLIVAAYPFSQYPASDTFTFTPSFTADISQRCLKRLDPLYIDSVGIYKDGLKLDLYNIQVTGLEKSVIKKVSIDKINRLIRIIFTADYTLKSQYNVGGYIFTLPIFGNGDFTGSFPGVEIDMAMPFEVVKDVYGREIIDLKGYQYSVEVKALGKYHFTNLYSGNKQSSDRALELINQNWRLLSKAHGRMIFDKVNDRIFNALRIYLHSQPLNLITLPYFY